MHRVVSRVVVPVVGVLLLGAAGVAPAAAASDTAEVERPAPLDQTVNGGFTSVPATQVFDSRPAHIAAGGTRTFGVQGGSTGIPTSDVAAVSLTVTVLSASVSGYVTVYSGPTRPGSTTVNFPAHRQLANAAVVKVGAGGQLTIFNGASQTVDAVVAVTGYFAAGGTADGSFTPVGPLRVVDTNTSVPTAPAGVGAGSIAAGGYKSFRIAGANDVPVDAGGAIMNVTVVPGATAGYVAVGSGATRPATSNVNLVPGQTLGTLTAVRLAPDGTFSLFNASSSPVRIVVDLAGWFRGSTANTVGQFTSVAPTRLFSSRTGQGTAQAPLASGATRTITLPAGSDLAGAGALALTLTAAGATAAGSLTAYSGTRPTTSTVSFAPGVTVPGFAFVPVSATGTITVYNSSAKPVDIIGDVAGFVRTTTVDTPSVSTSRYIRDSVTPGMTPAQVTAATRAIGMTDGGNASTTDPQVVLLQFGAQSLKAGGDGSGTGNQRGVRLSATDIRITYPQVVAAVDGYVAGYAAGRGSADNRVTVAVGTSNDGYKNPDGSPAAYTPAAKGADWANRVIEPAISGAPSGSGITIVAADDIEAGFDGDMPEITTWINAYLAAGPNALINNGAALGCPTGAGQVNRSCQPIGIPGSSAVHTWTQNQYWQVSGGIDPSRISVLPQVYRDSDAAQWANISLSRTGGSPVLTFAGVLTSVAACTASGDCSSIAPQDAYVALTSALAANSATAATSVPAVTDIAIS